jgi:putative acetyltransferase
MLRLVRPEDLDPVFRIYMHEQNVPYLAYDPLPLAAFKPIFHDLMKSGSFYVWDAGSQISGFCGARRLSGRTAHTAHLGPLAIAAEEHGTGLARTMLEAVIDRLQQQGVARVELMTSADNPRALAFYRKLGFQHEGTMRASYKRSHEQRYVDDVFLAKLLAPLPTD